MTKIIQTGCMKLPARFFGLLFAFILIFFFAKASFAQTITPVNTQTQYLTPNTNSNVSNNLHNWTQNVMLETMSALGCQLAGADLTTADHKCLGFDTKTGKIGYVQNDGGLLGLTAHMIAALYTPPARTGDFVNYVAGNFGLTKPSFAASNGLGFEALSPLTDLWVLFRNFVYILFVLVFLIIGIAVMFRVKIDPRTVMTIQNQIPKIIIGIILVTFSFAIAGLLIDFMYALSWLLTGLILNADTVTKVPIYQLVGATNPINAANTIANNGSWMGGIGDVAGKAGVTMGGHLGDLFNNDTGRTITTLVGSLLGAILFGGVEIFGFSLGGIGGAAVGGVAGLFGGSTLAGGILSIIAFLIIVIAIIASMFRLWFQLLMAYISILVDIIFAPIWIVAGLIPGSKINFSAWIRNLMANLAAFPAALVMFALARVFMDAFGNTTSQNVFVPPLIGNPGTPHDVAALIAMGFILMTPSVVKLMKTLFGAPQGGFGPIMEGLSSGFGMISSPTRRITGGLFGKNPYTNQPRMGTAAVTNFFRRRFGQNAAHMASVATGAGPARMQDDHGNWVTAPVTRNRPAGGIRGMVIRGLPRRTRRGGGGNPGTPPPAPGNPNMPPPGGMP